MSQRQHFVMAVFTQVFIAIAILSLFLFLILVCYVCAVVTTSARTYSRDFFNCREEFRFDQFNITLCLLAYSVTLLLLPHMKPSPRDKLDCLAIGVALNYSLLAVFAWKMLSAFNMLVFVFEQEEKLKVISGYFDKGSPGADLGVPT
ncbi:hypothetical protein Ciccas_005079 [Cichlidogyrus casuarinus]|uniref:Uncharacterized protein n=1 Tax=Cichlidogyrus casuarinus TaxID=1844966 RepID=A0ABD2QAK0_9PLAT